jgi:hypothetical protein
MMKWGASIAAAACWLGLSGAGHGAGPPANEPAPTAADLAFFEVKVRPILFDRCQGCHSTRAKKRRGGLLLDSRTALFHGGDGGPVVVPGRPQKSRLVRAVRYADLDLQMPPKGKLPAAEISLLEEWVRRGAPFPGPGRPVVRETIDLVKGRKFWSFQPLRSAAPPAVRDAAWPRRRIDYFILADLEKRGLAPSAAASRRVLIRRATFDLLGLPPTPREVDAFLRDERPDTYGRLVERLLASPQHGERWGRFWLDLVRYCDVPEPWSDAKGAPHLYRDWVVRALNADLPYDCFTQLQLAADLMPGTGPADRAALGLLGLSPTYWKELKLDKDVIKNVVAEEWEERIHAVCSTFLGLTVACARCHDHKFDPISQRDYYALAGVFASVRVADRPVIPDEVAAAARRACEKVRDLEGRIRKLAKKMPVDEAAVAALRAEAERWKKTPGYDVPEAPGVEEASLEVLADGPDRTKLVYRPRVSQDVPMHVRGNPASRGPVVPRRFLAVLSPDPPRPFRLGSGRLELARALVGEGGPLAARVIVSRVWQHHFGRGLVATPSDFGAQGERPTHPALLDDLAHRFVAQGWSLKWLHREIMLSAAYMQSSSTRDRRRVERDPDNRWLGRMPRQRLEVEAWRDAVLVVSGSLDRQVGGPSRELDDPGNRRRTLYSTVRRRDLHDLLRLHDFPDPIAHSPARTPTTTPLQQLFTLNSPFLRRHAEKLAARIRADAGGGAEAPVRRAYQLLYGRPPTVAQVGLANEFLAAGGQRPEEAWRQYAQVLLGSNEFVFID